MKQIGRIALVVAVNLRGCAVGAGIVPKYKIAVSKETKQLPPNEWCSVGFILANNRSFDGNPWIACFGC